MGSEVNKIMAIDDNQDNLGFLFSLLTEAFPNAIVLSAPTVHLGLEIAANEKPEVILLDIIMCGGDGFEECGKLKTDKDLHDIPEVFLTAIYADKECRLLALKCSADALLFKPIDEGELIDQIRAILKI